MKETASKNLKTRRSPDDIFGRAQLQTNSTSFEAKGSARRLSLLITWGAWGSKSPTLVS